MNFPEASRDNNQRSTSPVKQVICVKWGTAYGPEYVNRLYGMLRRHITGEFRLVCLTDNAEGLRPEVDAYDLPELGCEWPKKSMGKWRKLVMWSADMGEKTNLTDADTAANLQSQLRAWQESVLQSLAGGDYA